MIYFFLFPLLLLQSLQANTVSLGWPKRPISVQNGGYLSRAPELFCTQTRDLERLHGSINDITRAVLKQNSISTESGPKIMSSCSQYNNKFEVLVKHIDRSINSCIDKFNFSELKPYKDIADDIYIDCHHRLTDATAHTKIVRSGPKIIQYNVNPFSDQNIIKRKDLTTETHASILFHEILHQLDIEKRGDHNNLSMSLSEQTLMKCSDSVFADRVYLMQAICFQDTQLYRNLKSNYLLKCRNNCIKTIGGWNPLNYMKAAKACI